MRSFGWLPLGMLVAELAAGEVTHDLRIEIDPDTRRVEVRDTLSLARGGTIDLKLPRAPGISDLSQNGAEVEAGRAAITGQSPFHLSYTWRVPPPLASDGISAVLNSEGGFLPDFPSWLPRSTGGRDRYRLTIVTPAAYRSVSTGKLIGERLSAKDNLAIFELPSGGEPPSVMLGPYRVKEVRAGETRVRTYFYPEQQALADDYLEAVTGYLDRYGSLLGSYPYADFHVVASPLPVGLAMRNLTYVSRQILHLPFMRARSLAHEVLHAWWGSAVRPDYSSGNWAEGLTTYLADYALAEERGADAALEMRLAWLRDYNALPLERDRALRAFRSRTHDASQVIGYGKTAYVFHMLRRRLGEERFLLGLRGFWSSNRFRTAGWKELQTAFEAVSGEALDRFFTQWLDRAGAPQLALVSASAIESAGTHRVRIEVGQQTPPYSLRIPVLVETAGGDEWFTVELDDEENQMTIALTEEPFGIAIDPRFELFRRLEPAELPTILRDITLSNDAVVFLATRGEEIGRAARRLTERLLDIPGEPVQFLEESQLWRPLLLIGVGQSFPEAFSRAGVTAPPKLLDAPAAARVWTHRSANGLPRLAIWATDLVSLEALIGALPHYGRKSWLLLGESGVVHSGVWPAAGTEMRARFTH